MKKVDTTSCWNHSYNRNILRYVVNMHHCLKNRCPGQRTIVAGLAIICTATFVTHNYRSKNLRLEWKLSRMPADLSAAQSQQSGHQQDRGRYQQVIKKHSNSIINDSVLLPTSVNRSFTLDRPLHWTPDWYENYDNLGILLSKRREDIIKR